MRDTREPDAEFLEVPDDAVAFRASIDDDPDRPSLAGGRPDDVATRAAESAAQ